MSAGLRHYNFRGVWSWTYIENAIGVVDPHPVASSSERVSAKEADIMPVRFVDFVILRWHCV